MTAEQSRSRSESRAPGFEGATGWLNSTPLTAHDLLGKVTLVNFWTYTCVNWLRQLPYLRAWDATYRPHGLVTVGVHTPEFGFERRVDNVELAVREMGISYPVALDSDYAVWASFANHYWPALYFVDREGRIRHHHFGEGAYDRSEQVIRELLGVHDLPAAAAIEAQGAEIAADWDHLQSPETYLGSARSDSFAYPSGPRFGQPHTHTEPPPLPLNHWSLHGTWAIAQESCTMTEAAGSLVMRFHARDLNLVMGPTDCCDTVHFRVTLDGHAPDDAHGEDVDAEGFGAVTHQRLHQLIRQTGHIEDRTFEITFLDPAVQVFALTFG
ncbi:redoxin domain-containing protein [Kribbella sp. NPDC000426]|uniref:redoxin domain-containing protein n=1 Tax=Kribbella sp. NPDC000426 TaxID=3154255 RepID=UPI00332B8B78